METLAVAFVSALASFCGAWGAVGIKLQWLRRDVDDLRTRVRAIELRENPAKG